MYRDSSIMTDAPVLVGESQNMMLTIKEQVDKFIHDKIYIMSICLGMEPKSRRHNYQLMHIYRQQGWP